VFGAVGRIADRLNPITSGPAAPLKTESLFAAYAPSLMPRQSFHQGIAAGASLLAADAVGRGVDAAIRRVVPGSSPFAMRIGARAVVAAAGFAVSRIPETDDEPTTKASLRTAGRLATSGAIGGAIYETGLQLRERVPSKSGLRPIITGAAGFAGAMYHSKQLLAERESVIKPWSADDRCAPPGPAGSTKP
jgi:hypothetical protein